MTTEQKETIEEVEPIEEAPEVEDNNLEERINKMELKFNLKSKFAKETEGLSSEGLDSIVDKLQGKEIEAEDIAKEINTIKIQELDQAETSKEDKDKDFNLQDTIAKLSPEAYARVLKNIGVFK